MALLDYEAQLCSGCGGYLPDTTEEDASYVADIPARCHRCDAVQSMQAEYSEQKNAGALAVWPVRRKN